MSAVILPYHTMMLCLLSVVLHCRNAMIVIIDGYNYCTSD